MFGCQIVSGLFFVSFSIMYILKAALFFKASVMHCSETTVLNGLIYSCPTMLYVSYLVVLSDINRANGN